MAFDEIAGISAAEEAARVTVAEALTEAKRIVAQAHRREKRTSRKLGRRLPPSLHSAESRHGPRLRCRHRRYTRRRRTKKRCCAQRLKAAAARRRSTSRKGS